MEANGYQLAYIISTQHTLEAQEVPTNSRSEGRSEPTNNQTSNNVRRHRTAFTPFQEAELKREFAECSSLYSCRRKEIADKLGLCERVVKIWFQNQRQKARRERQTRSKKTVVTATNVSSAASSVTTSLATAPRVPPVEITEIPVFKPKTGTRVAGLIPRDPSKAFHPQLIVSLSASLAAATPDVADQQPQPEDPQQQTTLGQAVYHQQEHSEQEQTSCPTDLLRKEIEAYTDQFLLDQQSQLQMTAPPSVNQPLHEDILHPQLAFENGFDFSQQMSSHQRIPEQPELDIALSLELEQEIEKFLARPSEDEGAINISEFLDFIDESADLPDQSEKHIPDPTLAPPIDFNLNFDF